MEQQSQSPTRCTHIRTQPQDLEQHLPAGLHVVGVYGGSVDAAMAAHKELGLASSSLLVVCTADGATVMFHDAQVRLTD